MQGGDDMIRSTHAIFVEGICFGFDLLLCPAYLMHMDPYIETFELFRSMGFFNLVMFFGCSLGSVFAALSSKRRIGRTDPFLLPLAPILFFLWSICRNASMLVIVKLLQGTLLGYYGYSSIQHGNDHKRSILFFSGAISSTVLILIFFTKRRSFGYSAMWTGMILSATCAILGIIRYIVLLLRSSAETALQVPQPLKLTNKTSPNNSQHNNVALNKNNVEIGEELSSSEIPARYIRGCGKDAASRWMQTLQWRKANQIDTILLEEQPQFDLIKECYPSYLHGRGKNGCPVVYEVLGKINIARLKENGVDRQYLLRHYLFLAEYLWTIVEPNPEGQVITVMDIKGVGMADLLGDALEFIKLASKAIQLHYPERCYKMFIINAPYFFNLLWSTISALLHENTRRKISILGSDLSEMQKYIDVHELPSEYGGTSAQRLGQSLLELEMRSFVRNIQPGNKPTLLREKSSEKIGLKRSLLLSDKETCYVVEGEHRDETASITSDSSEDGINEWETLSGWGRSLYTFASSSASALRERLTATASLPATVSSLSKPKVDGNQAHLGRENSFVFDATERRWVVRGISDEPLDEFDENEREIIKAIEAAHDRKMNSSAESATWKQGTKPGQRHFYSLLALYCCWRMQVIGVIFAIPVCFLLAIEKGGVGVSVKHLALLFFLSFSFQLLLTLSPYALRTFKFIEDIKSQYIFMLRIASQFQGIALGLLSLLMILDRGFMGSSSLLLTVLLALSLNVLLSTLFTAAAGLSAMLQINSEFLQYFYFYILASDALGSTAVMLLLSLIFGDVGVSKYNSSICIPFVLGAAANLALNYFATQQNYPMYIASNYLLVPTSY